MKTLIVGSHGFIGSHLVDELPEADYCDPQIGSDIRNGIHKDYDSIIFLACDQADTREAFEYNESMYWILNEYRKTHPNVYLIYISSAAVYTLNSWYAISKQVGEAYADRFENRVILRLSNVYGNGDGHGAPDRFLRGGKIINGKGEQIRDLIHVEQVVTTILNCLKWNIEGFLNVSTGIGTSVNNMFKIFGSGEPVYKHEADTGITYSVLKPGRIDD